MTTPDETTLPDEDILRNHLSDLRSEARMYAACESKNPDTVAHYRELSASLFKTARALHRMMEASGIRGIGPVNY